MTYSRVTSELDFWLLRDRVEKFGLSKLPKSISKVITSLLFHPFLPSLKASNSFFSFRQARLGLNLIATLLLQPSTCTTLLNSGPLKPYAFDPVPSPLSLALRAKLDEARQAWLADQDRERSGKEGDEEELEPGKIWRVRWKEAVKRGRERFRERVCKVTGLLCDEEKGERC